ncbi:MAG: hypothetical protein ACTSWN_08695 [Promethearchaeota archaeon]
MHEKQAFSGLLIHPGIALRGSGYWGWLFLKIAFTNPVTSFESISRV